MQTPHHFYSPDPFERNLGQFRKMPNEGELFYGIVQDGNDFWNATFFCGSCAVLRRPALLEIGGIAVETVTEDCHTALRLHTTAMDDGLHQHSAGGRTGYGEPFQPHWTADSLGARDGADSADGESAVQPEADAGTAVLLFQRVIALSVCAAEADFSYRAAGLPALWMGEHLRLCVGDLCLCAAAYCAGADHAIRGCRAHTGCSFWNEIYEAVLAPYILYPTMLALINPKLGQVQRDGQGRTGAEVLF